MIGDGRLTELVAPLNVSRLRDPSLTAVCAEPVNSGSRKLSAAQARRHAAVLAAARSLFNEGGGKLVTLRRLVARSGVTAPTIYNLVGSRDDVLEQAMLEYLDICVAASPPIAAHLDLNNVNGFAETLWLSTQAQPSYARRQIQLVWRAPEGRRLAKTVADRMIDAIGVWVLDLCGRSRLAKRIGHETIAAGIEAQMRVALLDWADGIDGLLTLRRKLARASICLLRFVDEGISTRMATWIESLEAR